MSAKRLQVTITQDGIRNEALGWMLARGPRVKIPGEYTSLREYAPALLL